MTTYAQHLNFLQLVLSGAMAELQGFRDAEHLEVPAMVLVPKHQQSRYMQGWHDGKAKKIQEEVTG